MIYCIRLQDFQFFLCLFSNYSPCFRNRGDHDTKRCKTGRFRQRVSDETLGSMDGFMRVLNHDPLSGETY
jgi:hypothetical protein